jgi:hypothetical protein
MKNLTVPVPIPNVTKWQALDDYRPGQGLLTVRVFYGPGQARWKDLPVTLSDVATGSTGINVNTIPQALDDTIISINGVGAVNAMTNAGNAYRTTAGNHNARMAALETQLQVDGIVNAQLVGT